MKRVAQWWRGLGSLRARRLLLVVLAAGAVLRVAWVAHASVEPRFASDPGAYLLQGKQIANGHGYTNPLVTPLNAQRAARGQPPLSEQASSFYPPGYPTFIAGMAWIAWHTPIPDDDAGIVRTVGYAQAMLGVISILLLYAIARRVSTNRVALVAAALMAVYPGLITLTATLQLETVFMTLSLATILVLLPIVSSDPPPAPAAARRLLFGGVMIGAVALVRPTIALLLVAFVVAQLPVWARAKGERSWSWRETVVATLILAAASAAMIVPWTIRNELALHAFVPISTGIGPALCMARNPEATGRLDSRILVEQCAPAPANRTPAQDDVESNRFATNEAIKWVIHHPLSEVRMWFWRTVYAYRDDTTGIEDFGTRMDPHWRDVATTLSDSAGFVVLAFAAFGGVALARTRRREARFFLAATVCFAAVPVILFGDPRYRVPAEPLFIVLAAVAIGATVDGTRRLPDRGSVMS